MSESKEPSKYEEVDLLISSIDHLKESQQKLTVIAQAAKERRGKALSKPSASAPSSITPLPPQPTSATNVAPSQSTVTQGPQLQESAIAPLKSVPDGNIELNDVVESLKVSKDAIAHEEFHGLHSK
jgi:hypothetical protein